MANEVVHSHSTYDVIELIGTSRTSWEDAAKNVVEVAAKHLRELRVAEVVKKDLVVRDGKVEAYRRKPHRAYKDKVPRNQGISTPFSVSIIGAAPPSGPNASQRR
jgi:dodecin